MDADTEILSCNSRRCPFWRTWTQLGPCSATCDGGTRNRTRVCAFGNPGDVGCEGLALEIVACNTEDEEVRLELIYFVCTGFQ